MVSPQIIIFQTVFRLSMSLNLTATKLSVTAVKNPTNIPAWYIGNILEEFYEQ